jgi:hypothetical protein|tara:strand:+ start:284 stop:529 length:246 start_codon:yes stop_codon:yes gene_type:complete
MKSMFNIACSMVSLDVVFVSFFSFTRHPFSFNHFEVVEEADAFEESLVILEKVVVVVRGTSSFLSLAGEKRDGLFVHVFAR